MEMKKTLAEVGKFETLLGDTFKKAPHLPKDWKDLLVRATPWLALLAAIFSVLAIWGIFSMLSTLSKLGFSLSAVSITGILGMVVLGICAYFYAIAYKPLTENKKLGWDRLFYAQIISIIYAITNLFQGFGSFLGSAVGIVIGLYLLFEIRDHYKK